MGTYLYKVKSGKPVKTIKAPFSREAGQTVYRVDFAMKASYDYEGSERQMNALSAFEERAEDLTLRSWPDAKPCELDWGKPGTILVTFTGDQDKPEEGAMVRRMDGWSPVYSDDRDADKHIGPVVGVLRKHRRRWYVSKLESERLRFVHYLKGIGVTMGDPDRGFPGWADANLNLPDGVTWASLNRAERGDLERDFAGIVTALESAMDAYERRNNWDVSVPAPYRTWIRELVEVARNLDPERCGQPFEAGVPQVAANPMADAIDHMLADLV